MYGVLSKRKSEMFSGTPDYLIIFIFHLWVIRCILRYIVWISDSLSRISYSKNGSLVNRKEENLFYWKKKIYEYYFS